MPKSFTVPLTPGGQSALATLPPWHYSSDRIVIEYWTDPKAIAALLPPGVAPDENPAGARSSGSSTGSSRHPTTN